MIKLPTLMFLTTILLLAGIEQNAVNAKEGPFKNPFSADQTTEVTVDFNITQTTKVTVDFNITQTLGAKVDHEATQTTDLNVDPKKTLTTEAKVDAETTPTTETIVGRKKSPKKAVTVTEQDDQTDVAAFHGRNENGTEVKPKAYEPQTMQDGFTEANGEQDSGTTDGGEDNRTFWEQVKDWKKNHETMFWVIIGVSAFLIICIIVLCICLCVR